MYWKAEFRNSSFWAGQLASIYTTMVTVDTYIFSKEYKGVCQNGQSDDHWVYRRMPGAWIYQLLHKTSGNFLLSDGCVPSTTGCSAIIRAKSPAIATRKSGRILGRLLVSSVRSARTEPTPSAPRRSNQLKPCIVYWGWRICSALPLFPLRVEDDEPVSMQPGGKARCMARCRSRWCASATRRRRSECLGWGSQRVVLLPASIR